MIRHGLGITLLLFPLFCLAAEKPEDEKKRAAGMFIPFVSSYPQLQSSKNPNYFMVIATDKEDALLARVCRIYNTKHSPDDNFLSTELYPHLALPLGWNKDSLGVELHQKRPNAGRDKEDPILGIDPTEHQAKVAEAPQLHTSTVLFLYLLSQQNLFLKNVDDYREAIAVGQEESYFYLTTTMSSLVQRWTKIHDDLAQTQKKLPGKEFTDQRLTTIVAQYPKNVLETFMKDETGKLMLCCGKEEDYDALLLKKKAIRDAALSSLSQGPAEKSLAK